MNKLFYLLFASAAVIIIGTLLIYFVESPHENSQINSYLDAAWWTIATVTTVGYGDVFPVTVAGRILAGITALTSIGLVAMPAGIMAAAFSNAFQELRQNDQASIVA